MKIKILGILILASILLKWNAGIANDTKDVALVFKTNGKVELFEAKNETWKRLKRGNRLDSGDKLRTGDKSLAAVVFTDDKSLMKIRSRSNVVIHGEREETSIAKRVYMEFGEVFVNVKKQKSTFRLETPTGVAAVKGTQFYGMVDESGNMTIIAMEGIIELMNRYGSVLLNAGETGKSDGENPPTKEKTDSNQEPDWGGGEEDEQYDEIEIEFKSPDGEIKKLKIKTKSQGNEQ